MRRNEVETHNTGGCGGPYLPAVNAKYYGSTYSDEVEQQFHCSAEVTQRALQWQWESARERFWEDVQEWAEKCFGEGVKVYCAGRSGGWAVVEGLPPLDGWDAIQLSKWAKFAKMCSREVDFLTSLEVVLEDIEANRWAEENSEHYNHSVTADGEAVCLADVPRCAHCK